MAPRKNKRPTVARVKKAPKVTEKTLGESIIEQMQRLNSAVEAIHQALCARNDMLSVVTSDTATPAFIDTDTKVGASPAGMPDTANGDTKPAPAEPVKRKRGRPSKAELAARAAAAEKIVEQVADATDAAEMSEAAHAARVFPKMCPCGVREDLPPHLHGKGCPVHAPKETPPAHRPSPPAEAPAPPATPTLDDVRAVAIAFVGKHGKEKLAELFKTHGLTNLSSAPVESLPTLLAALQKEV